MPASENWGLHWFRRDLRVCGNQALRKNWKDSEGKTLGIFCFDSSFLGRPDFSHNRFAFFMQTLKQVKSELQLQGSDLLVVDARPQVAFPKIIAALKQKGHALPSRITWNRDYEPFARARDHEVQEVLKGLGLHCEDFRDHLVLEPWEISKSEPGSFYQVYSPFAKQWFKILATEPLQERVNQQKSISPYLEKLKKGGLEKIFSKTWKLYLEGTDFPYADALEDFINRNNKSVTISIPEAGLEAGYKKLQLFKNQIDSYQEHRDFPSQTGTSQISMFLKNGSLVPTQVLFALNLQQQGFLPPSGKTQYAKELAWREFYYHILYHKPTVEQEAFLPQYKNMPWENKESFFQAWCAGQTGFPIVDAGMRQLLTTGWMHNRVRMIVASFLTKDLLVDWRWGENHFMKLLLDGDLACNNGGWQWAASTGCDPQPYFRIFNPWLQSAKFDPEAKYIKTFVPELVGAKADEIHSPDSDLRRFGYVKRIVDHAKQKEKALALFKGLRG
jgi:deoxyribodipyrimidine photo-lyase